jgi:uncharacterized protein YaaR (DUF327 family)
MLSWQNLSAEVRLEMDRAPVDQTSKFQPAVCESLIFTSNGMGELAIVPQKIQEAFLDWVNSTGEKLIRSPTDLKNIGEYKKILTEVIDSGYQPLQIHQDIVKWHRAISDLVPSENQLKIRQ